MLDPPLGIQVTMTTLSWGVTATPTSCGPVKVDDGSVTQTLCRFDVPQFGGFASAPTGDANNAAATTAAEANDASLMLADGLILGSRVAVAGLMAD
jgi:hypothetical protein